MTNVSDAATWCHDTVSTLFVYSQVSTLFRAVIFIKNSWATTFKSRRQRIVLSSIINFNRLSVMDNCLCLMMIRNNFHVIYHIWCSTTTKPYAHITGVSMHIPQPWNNPVGMSSPAWGCIAFAICPLLSCFVLPWQLSQSIKIPPLSYVIRWDDAGLKESPAVFLSAFSPDILQMCVSTCTSPDVIVLAH